MAGEPAGESAREIQQAATMTHDQPAEDFTQTTQSQSDDDVSQEDQLADTATQVQQKDTVAQKDQEPDTVAEGPLDEQTEGFTQTTQVQPTDIMVQEDQPNDAVSKDQPADAVAQDKQGEPFSGLALPISYPVSIDGPNSFGSWRLIDADAIESTDFAPRQRFDNNLTEFDHVFVDHLFIDGCYDIAKPTKPIPVEQREEEEEESSKPLDILGISQSPEFEQTHRGEGQLDIQVREYLTHLLELFSKPAEEQDRDDLVDSQVDLTHLKNAEFVVEDTKLSLRKLGMTYSCKFLSGDGNFVPLCTHGNAYPHGEIRGSISLVPNSHMPHIKLYIELDRDDIELADLEYAQDIANGKKIADFYTSMRGETSNRGSYKQYQDDADEARKYRQTFIPAKRVGIELNFAAFSQIRVSNISKVARKADINDQKVYSKLPHEAITDFVDCLDDQIDPVYFEIKFSPEEMASERFHFNPPIWAVPWIENMKSGLVCGIIEGNSVTVKQLKAMTTILSIQDQKRMDPLRTYHHVKTKRDAYFTFEDMRGTPQPGLTGEPVEYVPRFGHYNTHEVATLIGAGLAMEKTALKADKSVYESQPRQLYLYPIPQSSSSFYGVLSLPKDSDMSLDHGTKLKITFIDASTVQGDEDEADDEDLLDILEIAEKPVPQSVALILSKDFFTLPRNQAQKQIEAAYSVQLKDLLDIKTPSLPPDFNECPNKFSFL